MIDYGLNYYIIKDWIDIYINLSDNTMLNNLS